MRTLKISHENLSRIIEHARRDYPYEACGLVGGWDNVADEIIPVPNIADSPRVRFEMDRRAMIAAIIALQSAQKEVVAIYHSHPESPAEPSQTDIAQATWPDAIYLIVSLAADPVIRAWSIRDGKAEPAMIIES